MKNKKLLLLLTATIFIALIISLVACNQNPKTTDGMTAELQTAIDRNKAELDKKIADLTEKHNSQLDELKILILKDEQLLSDLKNQYEAKILELENTDSANQKAIADLKAEYTKKIEQIKKEIAEANATISANKTALETSIASLKSGYEAKVAELEALLDTIQNTDTTQNEKIAELERKIDELLGREKAVCTVTFDSNGGTPVASQFVNKYEKITRPADPTRDGMLFDGWYIEDEKWSFVGHSVTKDITLKANWASPGVTYTLSDDGAYYSVTGYKGTYSHVCIESTHNDLPVTAIASAVFENSTNLTRITLPNSVTSIGSSAFYGCTGLTEINIPNKVTNISSSTFYGCTSLTEITIPNSVKTIEEDAFRDSGLIKITVPNSVKSIGASAFQGCNYLETITLPFVGKSKSITTEQQDSSSASPYAFGYIFGGKTESKNALPVGGAPDPPSSTRTWIYQGQSAFKNGIINGNQYEYKFYGYFIPASLRNVTITDVTAISAYAFYGCTMLTSVIIPDSVTSIGANAFTDCVSPTRVDFSAE